MVVEVLQDISMVRKTTKLPFDKWLNFKMKCRNQPMSLRTPKKETTLDFCFLFNQNNVLQFHSNSYFFLQIVTIFY